MTKVKKGIYSALKIIFFGSDCAVLTVPDLLDNGEFFPI